MSEKDISSKIELIISQILSRKYNAKIKIKLVDKEEIFDNEHSRTS